MHIILSKPRGHFSSWWRHQMETFSTLLAICAGNSPVTGKFPAQRPVTWSFDVFFDQRLYKRLSKQSWAWWFETPSRPLWRHCNDTLLWIQPRITKTFGLTSIWHQSARGIYNVYFRYIMFVCFLHQMFTCFPYLWWLGPWYISSRSFIGVLPSVKQQWL